MTVLVSGYAKVDSEITVGKMHDGTIVLVLIVNKQDGKIIDAECSLVTEIAKNHVKEIFVGKNVSRMEEVEKEFNERYFGNSKKSILFAFKACANKYNIIKDRFT